MGRRGRGHLALPKACRPQSGASVPSSAFVVVKLAPSVGSPFVSRFAQERQRAEEASLAARNAELRAVMTEGSALPSTRAVAHIVWSRGLAIVTFGLRSSAHGPGQLHRLAGGVGQ